MKIKDIYTGKETVFSCEVFPPKPDHDISTIYDTIDELSRITPDFISVTYSPSGLTKERTIEISANIRNNYKFESLMHLTCIALDIGDIENILSQIDSLGIENILALRGDIPEGTGEVNDNGLCHASDLVELISKSGNMCIGVAGYPENHPDSSGTDADTRYLKEKIDKGADFIITQLFFDNEYFFRFMDRLEIAGIGIPVSAGIMPVFRAQLIDKMVKLCGASIPSDLQALLDRHGSNDSDMEKAGLDYASAQVEGLLKQGVSGIHIYAMNRAHHAVSIARNTGMR